MILPGNIQRIFDEARCPICQASLHNLDTIPVNLKYPFDEPEHEDEIGYLSEMYCPDLHDHYILSLEWSKMIKDPTARADTLYLRHNDNEYALVIKTDTFDIPAKKETTIIVRPLDEDGHFTEERDSHSLFLDAHCFDLSNFNQECYIDKIETLMLFK